jgi:hypothetical protein
VGRALAGLARTALRVGAGDVEVAEHAIVEGAGGGDVAEHLLGHQLGPAVGVDRAGRAVLVERYGFRRAIGGGGGREEDVAHARPNCCANQGVAGDGVVAVIEVRVGNAFGHHDRAGEMHDRGDPVVREQAFHRGRVADVDLDQRHALRHASRRPLERLSATTTGQPASWRARTAWLPM